MKRLMVLGAFWSLWGFVGLAEVRVAPLAEMRDALSVPSYDAADRALLCRQSLMVMEELFVHRELKVKDFGVQHDPVPRLQALCQSSDRMDNKKFHRTVSDIFIDLHDLHTNYSGARPLSCGVAFIPVKFGDASTASGEHQILVARKLNTGAEHVAGIQAGMRLMAVDGEDVERVIERLGHASGGANASAMRHRAIQMLTMRGAATYPLPEADATELEVMDANGVRSKHLVPWLVQASTECLNQDDFRSLRPMIPVARAMNMGVDRFQREYNQIFGQDQVRTTRERSQPVRNLVVIDRYQDRFNRLHNLTNTPPPRGNERSEAIASVFEHAVIRTPAGHLGYIKLKSFYWESESLDVGTVTEAFRRTLEESFAGTVGLVVDVRGNPGGFIIFAEKLIQLFAPRGVEPTTVRMLANELNHEIFIAANGSDNRWSAALRQAMSRREKYMEPMAITPEAEANSIGQVWFKPVVVLTDAACYSACDLFSAGMQDNGAGVILGLHEHTGAGGANVMEYGTFRQILAGSSVNPFVELPFGHDIRVSWRQAIRAGKNAGALLENRGIISDRIIPMTPRDVVQGESRDLMRQIHVVLDEMAPSYVAGVSPLRGGIVYTANGESGKWREMVWGVDRLDVFRGGKVVERIEIQRSPNPEETMIELSDLVHSWRDERVTLVGMREAKPVLRIVRDVRWRGEYSSIPAAGIDIDFANGESPLVRAMELSGPDGGGWQVVDGSLRIGAGPDYEPRVLSRAVTSLQLNERGAKVTLDIELAAEEQSDVLRIYADNPETKERHEVFSGSTLRRSRTAEFFLPTKWQRADLVFEFESDENWNMTGPLIRAMRIEQ